jgi:hypothetical protein
VAIRGVVVMPMEVENIAGNSTVDSKELDIQERELRLEENSIRGGCSS